MSLEQGDREAGAVAVAPRVTLADIEAAIRNAVFFTGDDAAAIGSHQLEQADWDALSVLTICILVMRNGFTVIGHSACASQENYNADLGRKFAKEDAMRKVWALMGYALRDKLAAG